MFHTGSALEPYFSSNKTRSIAALPVCVPPLGMRPKLRQLNVETSLFVIGEEKEALSETTGSQPQQSKT